MKIALSTFALAANIFTMAILDSAQASGFAWSCFGPVDLGEGLRIIEAKEPGSDQVLIRSKVNRIAIKMTSKGPLTEEAISNIGGSGRDGIIQKRIYKDEHGRRWIYSNWDAHPTFRLYGGKHVSIFCYP